MRSARVGVWDWDIVTNHLRWSDEMLRLYDMQASEFNNTFECFMPRVVPEDLADVQRTIEQALATRADDFEGVHRITLSDGKIRWIEGRGRVISDANGTPVRMLGTAQDATNRRSAEDRLLLFTAHANDFVYDTAVDGTIANPTIVAGSFERTTGMTPEQAADRGGWAALIHPEDRAPMATARDQQLPLGLSVLHEYRITDAAGNIKWLRDRVVPVLDERGKLVRTVGGVTDITEQRALEERLRQAQRMEALARLAASVAHDFNNLLTVLSADFFFLRDPSTSPQMLEQSYNEIEATLERAARLTSSLLAFGRKQVGPLSVIDLGDALLRAQPMLINGAGPKVRVNFNIKDLGVRVAADPSDIQLVLLNLVLNARDAMPEGGAVLVETAVIEFKEGSAPSPAGITPGRYASLTVKDTGQGIPPAARNQIFEPFFTTKGHGGTGLGLPTCLGIVQGYGGSLFLNETSENGSTFQILLPLSKKETTSKEGPSETLTMGTKERVLLVEDDEIVRSVTERGLRMGGYQVTSVSSSEEALSIGEGLLQIDLLLTDVQLPGISGLDLAAKLRASFPSLPVLVVSGHVEDPRQQAELSAGTYSFLPKPFSIKELLARLREVVTNGSSV
jgi:PAS domain S-box-containing protein